MEFSEKQSFVVLLTFHLTLRTALSPSQANVLYSDQVPSSLNTLSS